VKEVSNWLCLGQKMLMGFPNGNFGREVGTPILCWTTVRGWMEGSGYEALLRWWDVDVALRTAIPSVEEELVLPHRDLLSSGRGREEAPCCICLLGQEGGWRGRLV
jgi:hypothetical protein